MAVPADLEHIFEIKLTEVMSIGCASRDGRLRPAASEQILGAAGRAACVVLGSGMGREQGTQRLIQELTERIEAPLVIDADGLNAHAGRIEKLSTRKGPLILTPHAGEMGRLLDRDSKAIGAKRPLPRRYGSGDRATERVLMKIVEESAGVLSEYTAAVATRLGLLAPKVILLGGLFQRDGVYVHAFRRKMKKASAL